ncbi:MAG: hypothetical protein A3F70_09295 [Acidobacteria bacterium RIFCSPLOWO2_12_FULL_67_14]|nr:MAG: hypothetical protein A3H29_02840 [Acidobacteria bacterium RIFCSPLOWO2_02_FULL_67_21]OFW40687.1 MAG: hypothetical protein A3F70_09295 [Acidobacteria bacterium RIFCSPLOWO2_12_FULL_67_14]
MALKTLAVAALLLVAVPAVGRPQDSTGATRGPDYVIGANDVLWITSYDDEDLTGRFTVDGDGAFTYPLLGRVSAGGMTLRAAEAYLKRTLVQRGLFRNPQITVAIDEYRSQKVFVIGEVRRPGVYPLSGSMTLVEALALADSASPDAGHEAVVVRQGAGAEDEEVIRANFRDLENGNLSQNVVLRDGDTVIVPRAETIYVFGEVRAPGSYALRDEDVTVIQALALAGGISERGSTGRVEIVRIIDGELRELKADLADVVRPGDTIVVPERFF